MKCVIASDHAGVDLKQFVKTYLESKGVDVEDLGPADKSRVDYPDFARKVAARIVEDASLFGVLICGTGIGISMSANRFKGVRAALCHDAYTASMAKAHNDANVLCMGARVIGEGTCESILDAWLATGFEGGRHSGRVQKIEQHGDVL